MRARAAAAFVSPARLGFVVFAAGSTILEVTRHSRPLPVPAGRALEFIRRDPVFKPGRLLLGGRPEVARYDNARDIVVWTDHGRFLGQAMVNAHGGVVLNLFGRRTFTWGNGVAASIPMLVAMSALFLLIAGVKPLRNVRNLDLLVLVVLVGAASAFEHEYETASAPVAMLVLAYLGVRCAWIAFRPASADRGTRPLLASLAARFRPDVRRLAGFGAAVAWTALCLKLALSSGILLDVIGGVMEGATTLIHGVLPYGHLTGDILHGDTYPIFSYALYMPVALVQPVTVMAWSSFTLALTVGALTAVGVAWMTWRAQLPALACEADGNDTGCLAALAYLAYPLTMLTVTTGTTDTMLGLMLMAAFRWRRRPALGSGMMAVAAWFKLAPVVLLPLWLAQFRGRRLALGIGAVTLVTTVAFGLVLGLGGVAGLKAMIHAIGFQAQRGSLPSPWQPLQPFIQGAALALIAAATISVLRNVSIMVDQRRAAALTASVVILVQLASNYWSFTYVTWFLPLVLLAERPWRAAADDSYSIERQAFNATDLVQALKY